MNGVTLRLVTLGDVRLVAGAGERLRGQRKLLALVAYVARAAPATVARETLATLLWGDRDDRRARHSLRAALSTLRREVPECVAVGDDAVGLREGALVLDAAELERLGDLGDPSADDEAIALWSGDFLQGFDDVGAEPFRLWLDAERERLRQRMARLLARSTRRSCDEGAWGRAAEGARRWASLCPDDPEALHRLVEALFLAGRSDEALAEYAAVRARRDGEGERDHAPELDALVERLRSAVAPPSGGVGGGRLTGLPFLTPELAGRSAEFEALIRATREAGARGTVALLEGDEGMGKTRLLDEVLRRLSVEPAPPVILSARAYEGERSLAWGAVQAVMSALHDAPALAGVAPEVLATAALAAPSLRERFTRLPPSPTKPDPIAVGRALGQVLAVVAEERPVVVALDDAHHADAASRAALFALARRSTQGVSCLLTVRSGPECASLVAELGEVSALRVIRLEPLGVGETDAILRTALALETEERRELASRLHAESSGNPLYVLALVGALVESGALVAGDSGRWRLAVEVGHGPLPLPATIQDAVIARLARLPSSAR